jgi:general secretion pathway protein A
MYTSFFGLNEKPFSITPDPRYLYLSERHAEALAHLLYGITESGGFIQLTGEVGTGKTTVVRSLLEQIPGSTDVALVLNPNLSPREFLLVICEELGVSLSIHERHSLKAIVDALNRRLLDAHAVGRRVVLIVDEAQNLSPDVLEQIRLLTNLETAKQKLLQIILIGQPELRELLARNDLRQLAQRITGRYHLEPLNRDETDAYVRHRLEVAGARGEIFSRGTTGAIYRAARGVPRLINVISDRALLGAYSLEQRQVTPRLARRAAGEVAGFGRRPPTGTRFSSAMAVGVGLALAALIGVFLFRGTALSGIRAGSPPVRTPPPATQARGTITPAPAPAPARTPAAATPPVVDPAGPAIPSPADEPGVASAGALAAGAAAAPSTPPPSLESRLSELAVETDTDTAFGTLLALWGVPYDPTIARPCEVAEANGLRCLYEQGSWRELVNLDRPAILSLTTAGGERHQVILAGMDSAGDVVLRLGERRTTADLASLMSLWTGEYLLLWRPESGPGRTLTEGAFGPDVLWLRSALSSVLDTTLPAAQPDRFDPVLAEAVRRFQREARLVPDGIAGARTMIALNSALELPQRNRLDREG